MSSYERFLSNPAEGDPLNVRIQSSLDGTLDELPDTFENWAAPHVKEAIAGLQRADEKRIAIEQNASVFLAQHLEFRDTKSNGEIFNRTLKAMFGDRVYSVEEFESAYQVCCANSLLELDGEELSRQEKQRKAAERKRAEAQGAQSGPSEDDLYSMSLEDLRRLDAIENQKRMQEAGERGGW